MKVSGDDDNDDDEESWVILLAVVFLGVVADSENPCSTCMQQLGSSSKRTNRLCD